MGMPSAAGPGGTRLKLSRANARSVVFWQQNSRCGTVVILVRRFGDDPNLAAGAKMVGRQDTGAVNQGILVGLPPL